MLRGFVPLSLCGSGLIVFTASLCRSWFRPNNQLMLLILNHPAYLSDRRATKSILISSDRAENWSCTVTTQRPIRNQEKPCLAVERKTKFLKSVRDYFKLSEDKTKTVRQIRCLKLADHNNHEKRNHMNAVSSKAIVWLYQLAHLAHVCFSHFG